jgi:hypothetical protein
MIPMVHSRIFGILLKSILAMIPKYDLTYMICSPITQIYKKTLKSGSNCFKCQKTDKQYQIL